MYVNPEYIRKCAEDDTLVGEILHELLHPTQRSWTRCKAIQGEHRRWNAAHDAEIDQQVEIMSNFKGERPKLVSERVKPETLGGKPGMVAEELYRLSQEKHPTKTIKCHCSGGSGVTGVKAEWESSPGGKGKELPQGLSEAESTLVLAAMAQDVLKHAEKRGRGSVPSGILRWAEEFGDAPPIDWRSMVQAKIRYAIDSKRGASPSYARPTRRSSGGLVLPVHRMPVPRVTIVGDTSGSMREEDIGGILAVVYDACETLGKVSVVSCDAAATEPVEIRHLEELKEHLLGGGGTDMVEGIRMAESNSPDAIVVVTDGDTPWPDEEPSVPVTVVLTRRPYGEPPTWAEVVMVNGGERDDDDL